MEAILEEIPIFIPTVQQAIFGPIAIFTVAGAVVVVTARNLFHSGLGLVATLFGVAGLYAMLEAEFLAISQILIYVGAISTLITFAIMLTRGMMFGNTSQTNRQWVSAAIIVSTLVTFLIGVLLAVPWPEAGLRLGDGEYIISVLGELFVTTYLIPFQMMALLLLVALAGAIMLARDRR